MDAGEAEASAPGRGRQMASTKSRSSKEPPRNERTTEGATKPVSEEDGIQRTKWRAGPPRWSTGGPQAGFSLTSDHHGEEVSPHRWRGVGPQSEHCIRSLEAQVRSHLYH